MCLIFCLLCRVFLPKSFSFGFKSGGDWFYDISSKRFKRFPVFYYVSVVTLGLKWKSSKKTLLSCVFVVEWRIRWRRSNTSLISVSSVFWPICSLVRFEWLTFWNCHFASFIHLVNSFLSFRITTGLVKTIRDILEVTWSHDTGRIKQLLWFT